MEGNDPLRGLLRAGFWGWRQQPPQPRRAEGRPSRGARGGQRCAPPPGVPLTGCAMQGPGPGHWGGVCGHGTARGLAVSRHGRGSWWGGGGGGRWEQSSEPAREQVGGRWGTGARGALGRGRGHGGSCWDPPHSPGAAPATSPSSTLLRVPAPGWAGRGDPVRVTAASWARYIPCWAPPPPPSPRLGKVA